MILEKLTHAEAKRRIESKDNDTYAEKTINTSREDTVLKKLETFPVKWKQF